VLGEYDRLVDEFGLEVVDAVGSITVQQQIVRRLTSPYLDHRPVEIAHEPV
jgi:hypothetical protein